MSGRLTRRDSMRLLGAGFAVASAGYVGSTTKASEFQDELSTAEQAASDYSDPKAALEDGFKIGGPHVPGMGWHFSHPKRLEEAAKNGLSIEKPPILTNVETEDDLKLGSVEYAAPTKALSEDPDLFSDENADATEEWHTHEAATHVFAVSNGGAQKPSEIPFEEWVTNDNWRSSPRRTTVSNRAARSPSTGELRRRRRATRRSA